MRVYRTLITTVFVLLFCSSQAVLAIGEAEFIVIAHPDVPIKNLTIKDLKRIYKKEFTHWPDGTVISPVESTGSVKQKFIRKVIRQNEFEYKNYWINQRMTNGKRPPKSFSLPVLILNYVTKTPGAIGFLKAGSNLKSTVQLVAID